ncbi:uncharacterized protein [Lolium perenne]|uniref:uncharacterized protein n=1 Tax=Lolium perenne TaxID=4522 RepID=UPI0021F52A69|nr:uncharacterized protein LOC127321659 [Lolium perenne]
MALVPHGGGAGGSAMPLFCPMLTLDNYIVWAGRGQPRRAGRLGGSGSGGPGGGGRSGEEQEGEGVPARALSKDILLQVSSKKTAAAVWESLKARFIGADRVKAARLSTLRGEFDRLIMADDEELDVYAGKIGCMAAKFASLGGTLSDAKMVKKLLDTVTDSLYMAVAGIEQFCDVETVCFDEVLGRLKPFQERTERRKAAVGVERHGDQLLLTAAQWEQRRRTCGGAYDDSGGDNNGRRGKCHNCGIRGHFARDCRKPKKEEEENQEEALLCDASDHPCLL